jgi:hypothetical protein
VEISMEDLGPVLLIGIILAFIGYRQWLREQRRRMIHRERIAAIEKGVEPPAYPDEPVRDRMNTKRVLFLSGLIWLAVGAGSRLIRPCARCPMCRRPRCTGWGWCRAWSGWPTSSLT